MKRLVITYLSTLAVLLPCDLLFLGTVGRKLFADNVGDMTLSNPRVVPAVAFYALNLAGIVIFVNGPASANWAHNLLYGALFGLFCYATFELTNMSVLKHWEWTVVVADTVWGAAVTAIAASVGGVLADWLLKKF
jgi:uncharacterized membrane protein